MKTVQVNASTKYEVKIGRGLLPRAGEMIAPLFKGNKLALVCDTNVAPLYADTAEESLRAAGFETCRFTFPAGEESKCGATYLRLQEFLAEHRLSRKDGIVALGGGVTGDLAGFAAATYLRGVDFVQIPTTLLAAVDSSVGGKTGIDLEAGKNLCGAFHQPRLVLCDTDTLSTLDAETFSCGMAEVIKYGVIRDAELFALLERSAASLLTVPGGKADSTAMKLLEEVVAVCVGIKRDVVEADEFEGGLRQILNYGHTAAHSIEKLSHYKVPHGTAVGAGMAIAAEYAESLGMLEAADAARLKTMLQAYRLPAGAEECADLFGIDGAEFAPDRMTDVALSDKKCSGGSINLVLPTAIGDCVIEKCTTDRLPEFFGG